MRALRPQLYQTIPRRGDDLGLCRGQPAPCRLDSHARLAATHGR